MEIAEIILGYAIIVGIPIFFIYLIISSIKQSRDLKSIRLKVESSYPNRKLYELIYCDEKTFLKWFKIWLIEGYGYLVVDNNKLHFIGQFKSEDCTLHFDFSKCELEWIGVLLDVHRNAEWFKIIDSGVAHYFFHLSKWGIFNSKEIFLELEKLQSNIKNSRPL